MTGWTAASTITAVASVIYLVGGWMLKSMIENRIKSEFDVKLEVLRADLRARDAQIDALRAGALAAMTDRHANLDKRRLLAVERLWQAVAGLAKVKMLSKMMQAVKVDVMIEVAGGGGRDAEGVKAMAEFMGKAGGIDDVKDVPSILPERPFLAPLVWALYSAYNLTLLHPVFQIMLIRHNQKAEMLADPKPMLDMVRTALPHQTKFIDTYGTSALNFLVDELEEALLKAVVESLKGEETDAQGILQAAAIMKQADLVAAKSEPVVPIPDAVKV